MRYLAYIKSESYIWKLGFLVLMMVVFLLAIGVPAYADTLQITTNQITSSASVETTPTIGNDGTSDLVVYTFHATGSSPGDIFYQRLNADGSASGAPVQVTTGETNDIFNDVSGDHIVYTARDSMTSMSGSVIVFEVSTSAQHTLGSA